MGCGASKPEVQSNGHGAGNAREASLVRAPRPDETYNFSSAAQSPKHTVCLTPSNSSHRLWLCRWDSAFRHLCGGAGHHFLRHNEDDGDVRDWLHFVGVNVATEKGSSAQVKMSLSCKNLAVSQSMGSQPPDPFAALYVADSRGHWEQVSKTEDAPNTRGNLQSPCPCLLACMHACLSACFTQPRA